MLRAIACGARIEQLVLGAQAPGYARRLARDRPEPTLRVSARQFDALSAAREPSGIGAVVRQRWSKLPPRSAPGLWLGLERVRSPGNVGALLRTCEAVGVRGLVLLGEQVDPFDPVAIRATMGSVFGMPLVRAEASEVETWKRRANVRVLGAAGEGARDYTDRVWRGRVLLQLGCERGGLSETQRALCDELVAIPMTGEVDSLNVAVAGGVLLYEARRQRGR